MRRMLTFAIIPLVLALVLASGTRTASAHEHRQILNGKYELVVGFLTEPAVNDEVNSIDLRVSDLSQATPASDGGEAVGAPVDGLETTLKADIIFADQTMTLTLEPRFRTAGAYNGWVIPAQPGDYSFHIYGTINGESVDETFSPGPETFSSVIDRATLEFPKQSASIGAAPIGSTSSQSGMGGPDLGGGVLLGGAALIALFGLSRAVRRRPNFDLSPTLGHSAGD